MLPESQGGGDGPAGVTQFGADGVAEPVYRLVYLRLDAPTHWASYQRSI